jgi:hypothetical protein
MSDESSLTVERGEKEAVASIKGWMQDETEASVLNAVRVALQSDEMPLGINETCGISMRMVRMVYSYDLPGQRRPRRR